MNWTHFNVSVFFLSNSTSTALHTVHFQSEMVWKLRTYCWRRIHGFLICGPYSDAVCIVGTINPSEQEGEGGLKEHAYEVFKSFRKGTSKH